MIFIYHSHKSIHSVINSNDNREVNFNSNSLTKLVFELAYLYPDDLVFWCDIKFKDILEIGNISSIFHSKNIFSTYSVSGRYVLSDYIHYVDNSFFCNPLSDTKSPTYFMSSEVGGIFSSVLISLKDQVNLKEEFDYFLCSLAKLAIPKGLFCYSDPGLVKKIKFNSKFLERKPSIDFKFVSQHWKKRWLFFLFIALFLRENKFLFLTFIKSFFYKKLRLDSINFNFSNDLYLDKLDFDVLIPTIGRKKYLQNFLQDLAKQINLPKNVIIIEQNPEPNSKSDLFFLESDNYPFNVIHKFTHTPGACNARNLGIDLVKSKWVFLADDDIRISEDFFEELQNSKILDPNFAYTFSCLKKNEIKTKTIIHQWDSFGSGCSFVTNDILKKIRFDTGFEFGFGEDSDFGMQIRKLGFDVIYLPNPEIIHLKAPIGGFRTKPQLLWDKEKIQPKPSPTVFLLYLKHKSNKQIYSFKLSLFINYYFNQSIKNPFVYYSYFKKQWNMSEVYAHKLVNQ
ncbi:MAG: glycosyltransferase family 2 protein [Algoriphagus sp.]|uniref:glycosyltransferase family 2 protein n=1 Tax=Algoriphagus sp. TaxID=1872435 RepID=UPI00178E73DC|nr:glycosyltransferase family A protein [Algoriphagus sp.]NVJ86767.1 glycosyltransferase family 2 protein [Algoriphagus sp.]